jgi:tetratricopeptide (TPR) repeat protein
MKLFNKKKKETENNPNPQVNGSEPDNAEMANNNQPAQTGQTWQFYLKKKGVNESADDAENAGESAASTTPKSKRFFFKKRKAAEKVPGEEEQPSNGAVKPAKPPWQWFWMKKNNADENPAGNEEQPKKSKEPRPVSAPRPWRVVLVGIFLLLLFALSGAGMGYASGIQQRLAQETQQKLVTAATHFNYGVQAMLQSNYEVARLQFEYVLQIDQNFPGLQEKYTQTMIEIAKNSQPTPTMIPTPTADMRGVETMFTQAQQLVNAKQGTAALVVLDTLRNQDIRYRTLEVDALYYMALRFSGIEKIAVQADQEGGLYDLTLASHFAPLDHEALNYATWARNYITAISFWNVNWERVVYYLNQVYSASPGLQDSKGNSVRSRTIEALWRYGDVLMNKNDFCEAAEYYQYSLNIMQQDKVAALYNSANLRCIGPSLTLTAIPPAPPAVVETPTPEVIPETPTP